MASVGRPCVIAISEISRMNGLEIVVLINQFPGFAYAEALWVFGRLCIDQSVLFYTFWDITYFHVSLIDNIESAYCEI